MKRYAKIAIWGCSWLAILGVCIAIGIATRMSYADYLSEPETVLDMQYKYSAPEPYDDDQTLPEEHKAPQVLYFDTNHIVDSSPIIVVGRFDGSRQYGYQSFISDVVVTKVIKGASELENTTIPVFEPVGFMDDWGTSPVYLRPTGMVFCGYIMMVEGDSYLLFISPKEYPEMEDRTGKPVEYVFSEHPYAKLNINNHNEVKDYIVLDDEPITLRESLTYEVALTNSNDVNTFYNTKAKLLETLGIGEALP